jgi:hypothetical protein
LSVFQRLRQQESKIALIWVINRIRKRPWISGIEAPNRKAGLRAAYDMSATRFFLRGSAVGLLLSGIMFAVFLPYNPANWQSPCVKVLILMASPTGFEPVLPP